MLVFPTIFNWYFFLVFEFPQVSWTLSRIKIDPWTVWVLLLCSNSFSLFSNTLEAIPNTPGTTGITTIVFFSPLARSTYLCLFSLLFSLSGPLKRLLLFTLYLNPWKFFKRALTGGLTLKSEWQQISSFF